jgi:hypothetical protein
VHINVVHKLALGSTSHDRVPVIQHAQIATEAHSCLQVLKDISAPMDGLYSVRDPLENRLGFVRWQMDHILAIQGSRALLSLV